MDRTLQLSQWAWAGHKNFENSEFRIRQNNLFHCLALFSRFNLPMRLVNSDQQPILYNYTLNQTPALS